MINYFAYSKKISYYVPLVSYKIKNFSGKARIIYDENNRTMSSYLFSYQLPINQDNTTRLAIWKTQEKHILDVLNFLFKNQEPLFKKIINSISLYNAACRIHPYNPNSSIVLIASAFESLLQIPKNAKKDNFAYAFKLLCGLDDRISEWAADLYDSRSHIVHGSVVGKDRLYASKDNHYPHFEIGRDVFNDFLFMILESSGLLNIKDNYKEEIIKELKDKIISNSEKVSVLYNTPHKLDIK